MEKRRFGRTGHESTVAIFGAAALGKVDQSEADRALSLVLEHGINHIDVAPSYGQAESRMGTWLAQHRERLFVGCKTMHRTRAGAAGELRESLARLKIDHFDLYQIHAVTSQAELDEAMQSGGALDAMVAARENGLTRFIGITGHGVEAPTVFLEALRRFDFDSVLFPLNFVQFADPAFRAATEALIQVCRDRDIGMMTIKSITKRPWGDRKPAFDTWYEPFVEPQEIQAAVDFVLSHPVTGLCTAGDTRLLPMVFQACENFSAMDETSRQQVIASAKDFEPLFA